MLNVVVVGFKLLLEVAGLVSEASKRKADAFEFALALDTPAVLGADINCDGVEEILVVVMAGEAVALLEAQDIFEGGAF